MSTYRSSQDHASRKRRGRPQIHLSLAQETVDLLDELVRETSGNRTTVVTAALILLRDGGQGTRDESEDP